MTKFKTEVEAIQYKEDNLEECRIFCPFLEMMPVTRSIDDPGPIRILLANHDDYSYTTISPTDWIVKEIDKKYSILKNEKFELKFVEIKT